MGDNARRVSGFKLPPIVRNATTVRRSNTDVSDERESVQGQAVKKFEPIQRNSWDASMPSLSDTTEISPLKRRTRRREQDGEKPENVFMKKDSTEVAMEEEPSRDEKISETLKKVKIRKKRSPKKPKIVMDTEKQVVAPHLPPLTSPQRTGDSSDLAHQAEDPVGRNARFSVLVGDMVAIRVQEKHFIKGQPCVGKVVAEADDRNLVLVHYYIGSYDGFFRPMMSRSSPYLRKVPIQNILCKFEIQTDGRLSPRTAIRIRQIVERPE